MKTKATSIPRNVPVLEFSNSRILDSPVAGEAASAFRV